MLLVHVGLNVGQGPVVVVGPQFLEGLCGFVCQEVEVGHVLSVVEDGKGWPVTKVEVR